MKEIELLEHVLANLKAGNAPCDGLLYETDGSVGSADHEVFEEISFHHPDRYYLAPRTHIVNTFEVPAPESEEIGQRQFYYKPCHDNDLGFSELVWFGYRHQLSALKNGQVFLTRKAAILNQKAQAKVDPYD